MMIVIALVFTLRAAGPTYALDTESTINTGHAGHWVVPGHPGQGAIVEVLPLQKKLALDWFSFADGAPGNYPVEAQRWFTGLGDYSADLANLLLFDTSGGKFAQPGEVNTVTAGAATFRARSCTEAVLSYQFNSGASGVLNLVRLTPAGLCLILSGQAAFPEYAFLRAEAQAEFEDGMSLSCGLDYILELQPPVDGHISRSYQGTLGGEARRTVLNAQGAGVGFSADAFGLVEVNLVGNRVTILYTLDLPDRVPRDQDSRFWYHLNSFSGVIQSDGTVTGQWRCAPLDTRGDESLFADGTWTLEPINDGSQTLRSISPN